MNKNKKNTVKTKDQEIKELLTDLEKDLSNFKLDNDNKDKKDKEISDTKYGTNKELTPTTAPQEIYQYSDAMSKHLPTKSLKLIENELLYSKEEVVIPCNLDRRFHGMVKDANNRVIHDVIRSDGNFRDREAKFRNQLKDKYLYRIPLKYICDIGKINFPTKIDMKIRLTLEYLQRLTYRLYY